MKSGSVRSLHKEKCIESVYSGGGFAWTADGSTLYTMNTDVVKAVKVDSPVDCLSLTEPQRVFALCLDEQNQLLAVAASGVLRILSVSGVASHEVVSFRSLHSAPVLHVCFADDSRLLITGSADQSIILWELSGKRLLDKMRGESVVSAMAVVGERVVVGYAAGEVRVCRVGTTLKLLHTLNFHNGRISSLSPLDEGSDLCAIFSTDNTATVLNLSSGAKKGTIPLFEAVEGGTATPDGRLVTVGAEGVVKEWDARGANLLRSRKIGAHSLESVSYNALRDELCVATADSTLVFIRYSTFDVVREIVGFHHEVHGVCFVCEEEFLVVASSAPELRVYDTTTFTCKLAPGHTAPVVSLVGCGWDKKMVASCGKDEQIIVWRMILRTLQPVCVASGHTSPPSSVAFSSSSSHPFLLSVGDDTMLKLWSLAALPETKEGKETWTVENVPRLTAASTLKAHGREATCLACSPLDSMAATGGRDKQVKLWVVDNKLLRLGISGPLPGHKRTVFDVRFSPNGQRVATASEDGVVRVFAVRDRTFVVTLEGHSAAISQALFVNNGTQIISTDSSGVIKIWTVNSGVCETTIDGHDDQIWSICSNGDESVYVTGGSDGKIVLWRDDSETITHKENEQRMKRIQETQTLDNLLSDGRVGEALRFALTLDRPHCAYTVLAGLPPDEMSNVFSQLETDQLNALLQFTVKWNTNSRTSHVAQSVLSCVLARVPPEEFLELPQAGQIIHDLLPYTARHFDRLDNVRSTVSLLDYTWSQMRLN